MGIDRVGELESGVGERELALQMMEDETGFAELPQTFEEADRASHIAGESQPDDSIFFCFQMNHKKSVAAGKGIVGSAEFDEPSVASEDQDGAGLVGELMGAALGLAHG